MLVRKFYEIHDPTTPNRQGPDVGHQYRSAIFTNSTDQKEIAMKVRAELDEEGKFDSPIITEVEPASTFWEAEEYHQDYERKTGRRTC